VPLLGLFAWLECSSLISKKNVKFVITNPKTLLWNFLDQAMARKKKETIKIKVPKQRNFLVVFAVTKKAGKHKDKKREMKNKHFEDHE